MKTLLAPILLITGLTACQTAIKSEVTDPITETEIKHILSEWERAYQQKDSSIMSQILHDDYVYSGDASGNVTTKAQYLKTIPEGDYLDFQFDFDSLDYKIYEDIAVVRAREKITIITAPTDSTESDTLNFNFRFTDVYQKKDGVAKALSTHSSPIVDK